MLPADPAPARVAETIARLDLAAAAPLNAYWLSLVGDRNAYAAQLQPLLRDKGMGVLIVRQEGFDNPNALMVDLAHLLDHNRIALLEALAHPRPDPDRIGIVLLARRELAMGQGTSPVIWPEWVPGVGRREVTCFITDVTRRVEVPLNAAEVDVGRIQSALFAVECALLRRLVRVQRTSPEMQEPFFRAVRRKSDPAPLGFLAHMKTSADAVRTARSYRPSVGTGDSVVSRLWELSLKTAANDLVALATDLAAALDIGPDVVVEDWWEGLIAVLARPPANLRTAPKTLCHHLVLTVAATCQYVTCAAHNEKYQPYPVNLLVAVVDDLYHALVGMETALNHLPDGRGAPRTSATSTLG